MYAGRTLHARNGIAFEHETENHLHFLDWQIRAVQGPVASIRENLAVWVH